VLSYATQGGSLECFEILAKAAAKLSHVGRDEETPLMAAANRGKQEVVKWLLQNFKAEKEGVSELDYISMTNKDGKTALDLARTECRRVVEQRLHELGGRLERQQPTAATSNYFNLVASCGVVLVGVVTLAVFLRRGSVRS
jgi:cob(I)alamin adenosyltransferase